MQASKVRIFARRPDDRMPSGCPGPTRHNMRDKALRQRNGARASAAVFEPLFERHRIVAMLVAGCE